MTQLTDAMASERLDPVAIPGRRANDDDLKRALEELRAGQMTTIPDEGMACTPPVEVVSLQPGDRLVLTYPGQMDPQVHKRIKDEAAAFFGRPVLVLEDGLRMAVVRGGEGDGGGVAGWNLSGPPKDVTGPQAAILYGTAADRQADEPITREAAEGS